MSKKSGQVYERRLIVKYIEDNGKDPVSGEELSEEDLLDIKTSMFISPPTVHLNHINRKGFRIISTDISMEMCEQFFPSRH